MSVKKKSTLLELITPSGHQLINWLDLKGLDFRIAAISVRQLSEAVERKRTRGRGVVTAGKEGALLNYHNIHL